MEILYLDELPPAREALLRGALPAGLTLHVCPRERLADALALAPRLDGIVGGQLPPELLAAATRLRFQLIPWAGVPRQDRAQLAGRPELALYCSHFNAGPTAEHAWALLLAAAKRLLPMSERLARGDWGPRFAEPSSVQLEGKALLLLGYGAIGRRLAAYGRAFGMRVSAVKRRPGAAPELDRLGTLADLPALLPLADALICSLPDTESCTGVLGAAEFALMKPGSLLVNVGRGSALDEAAFYTALDHGPLGAAGIDTWWRYPESANDPAPTLPGRIDPAGRANLVLSPHRASHVTGREEARTAAVAALLADIARGAPPPAVDREHWY